MGKSILCLTILEADQFHGSRNGEEFCPRIYNTQCVLSHSITSDSATPWTIAHQASLPMGFPRQEYWSGLPFSSLRDLSDQGIKLTPPALADGLANKGPPGKGTFTADPPGKLLIITISHQSLQTS